MGPPASSRPKDKGKERRKTKNQNFEAGLNRRVLWDLQPAAGQKRRKGKGQINYWHLSGSLCSWRLWGFQPAAGKRRRKERE